MFGLEGTVALLVGSLLLSVLVLIRQSSRPRQALVVRHEGLEALREEVAALRARVAALEAGAAPEPSAEPTVQAMVAAPVEAALPAVEPEFVAPPRKVIPPPPPGWAEIPAELLEVARPLPAAARVEAPISAAPIAAAPISAPPQPARPRPGGPWWEASLREHLLAKIGAVLLFLGVGFLLKYAYDHGFLPPSVRVAAVAVAAAGVAAIGVRLRQRQPTYALVLQGVAAGLLYLDVYFAHHSFAMLGPLSAMALFSLLGLGTTVAAAWQRGPALAVLGLCGAFLAVPLASDGEAPSALVLAYYTLLNAFIFGVSWKTSWRALNLLGFVATFVVGGVAVWRQPDALALGTVETALLLNTLLYLAIPIAFALGKAQPRRGRVDATLVFGTPAALLGLQATLLADLEHGLGWFTAGLAVAYAALAWGASRSRFAADLQGLRLAWRAIATVLGTLAVAFLLDRYPTFALWSVEAAGLFWFAVRDRRPRAMAFSLGLLVVAASMFLTEMPELPRDHAVWNDAALGMVGLALAAVACAAVAFRGRESLAPMARELHSWLLLWALPWWLAALGMMISDGCAEPAQVPTYVAALGATTLLLEFVGTRSGWRGVRAMGSVHTGLVAVLLTLQLLTHGHALDGLGALVWPAALILAVVTVTRRSAGAGQNPLLGFEAKVAWWLVVGLWASEQWATLRDGDHAVGLALAVVGHLLAGLLWLWRRHERQPPALSPQPLLLLALGTWLLHGGRWLAEATPSLSGLHAALGWLAGTVLLYVGAARLLRLPALAKTSYLGVFAGVVGTVALLSQRDAPSAAGGLWVWPLLWAAVALGLRQIRPSGALLRMPLAALATTWTLALQLSMELAYDAAAQGWGSAWRLAAWGVGSALVLVLAPWLEGRGWWPQPAQRQAYREALMPPAVVAMVLWLLTVTVHGPSGTEPDAWMMLANPLDLGTVAGFAALLAGWWRYGSRDPVLAGRVRAGLIALAFVVLHGVLLRTLAVVVGVEWRAVALLDDRVVQTALTVYWSAMALGLMWRSARRGGRTQWMAGAALLALVVLKLFVVDLDGTGTLARIVSFIGVGSFLLLLGYLAPAPPARVVAVEPLRPGEGGTGS
ncbi:MAG: DUF2339 domain-containing protein [Deltaproteobacteria bacterium]|nr:DUF2339 domain-containing protein [Deltaproteobacteria bacterium]